MIFFNDTNNKGIIGNEKTTIKQFIFPFRINCINYSITQKK